MFFFNEVVNFFRLYSCRNFISINVNCFICEFVNFFIAGSPHGKDGLCRGSPSDVAGDVFGKS